jgi:hypothetical protein
VDRLEAGDRIKLKRKDSIDGKHHYLSIDDVERIEDDVILLRWTQAEAQERLLAGLEEEAGASGENPQQHLRNSGDSSANPEPGLSIGQNPDEPDRLGS